MGVAGVCHEDSLIPDSRKERPNVRPSWLLILVLPACGGQANYVYECDGGATPVADSSTKDVTDGSVDAGIDVASDGACSAPTTFPSVGKCAGAADCASGDVCCATLAFDDRCFLTKLTHSCASPTSCPSAFQPFCGGNATGRLCDSPSDCTEPGFDRCCSFSIRCSSATLVMCASAASAKAAGASCL